MTKIEQAKNILKSLGLPEAQQNEMSALTLLALAGIKKSDKWANATNDRCQLTNDIMSFVNEYYKKGEPYAPNTRETFRRQVLHQFVQAAIVLYNPDEPDLPTNSPKTHYKLSGEVLKVIKSYGSSEWKDNVFEFKSKIGSLREKYVKDRNIQKIPVTINGEVFVLSPGKHNTLQANVINDFAPMFVPGGTVLYVGDTENKDLYIDKTKFGSLNIKITEHTKLPDIVICDDEKQWLFLIEAVTSHGPISPKRLLELECMTEKCTYGKVYVTAFPGVAEFKRYATDIAWETEVWMADTPKHMIHFNGDRFIGPR